MRKFLTTLLIGSIIFSSGCQSRYKHYKQRKTVYRLHDGRQCYYDSSSDLWFWLYMTNSSGNNYYIGNEIRPSGYSWQTVSYDGKNIIPDQKEIQEIEILEPENIIDQEIVVDERGLPEVDIDGNLVDPDQLAPDTDYGPDISPDSNSPDSSPDSGDGGGSDSGGGDSGGD